MPLLLDEDYVRLQTQGLQWEEVPERRFLILIGFPLPEGLYTVPKADVLVIIEGRYPEAGHDMLWTAPRLVRTDGVTIPAIENSGSQNNHKVGDTEYHRWSRHWDDTPGRWVPGKSNADTIVQRIVWALAKPLLI